jgi:NADPH-dependent curcumin reductase CurA
MTSATQQRAVTLARIPIAQPVPADFAISPIPIADLADGLVRVKAQYFSLDPFLRGVLSGRHMGHRCEIGSTVPGFMAGVVVESRDADYTLGDWVVGEGGWQEFAQLKKPRKLSQRVPMSTGLGVLGMPGLTAWAGIHDIARPLAGETVVISAAAGPVGSTAGQFAKALGALVVGIAGGPEKCAQVVKTFGFDACVDYKQEGFATALRAACPNGINVYFDNVGGAVLEACILQLALNARVVLCGLMDQYNQAERPKGPNLGPVIGARAMLKGLVVYDYYPRFAEFISFAEPLVFDGAIKVLEDVAHGIEATPEAFCRLMRGQNVGKALVKLV